MIGLLPLALLLERAAAAAPAAVERWYSRSAYPVWIRSIAALTGWLPIPLIEPVLLLVIVWLGVGVGRALADLLRRRRSVRNVLASGTLDALAISGAVLGLGLCLWGLNARRVPFGVSSGLDMRAVTVEELRSLCERLASETNALRRRVEEDGGGLMRLNGTLRDGLARATLGFARSAAIYPVLDAVRPVRPKKTISPVLSALGVEGVFCPFTGEAIVSSDLPSSDLPHAACHEVAHQLGFAREEEANYIAYVACRLHPDADFQYGGALTALSYSLSALAEADPKAYPDSPMASGGTGGRRVLSGGGGASSHGRPWIVSSTSISRPRARPPASRATEASWAFSSPRKGRVGRAT